MEKYMNVMAALFLGMKARVKGKKNVYFIRNGKLMYRRQDGSENVSDLYFHQFAEKDWEIIEPKSKFNMGDKVRVKFDGFDEFEVVDMDYDNDIKRYIYSLENEYGTIISTKENLERI